MGKRNCSAPPLAARPLATPATTSDVNTVPEAAEEDAEDAESAEGDEAGDAEGDTAAPDHYVVDAHDIVAARRWALNEASVTAITANSVIEEAQALAYASRITLYHITVAQCELTKQPETARRAALAVDAMNAARQCCPRSAGKLKDKLQEAIKFTRDVAVLRCCVQAGMAYRPSLQVALSEAFDRPLDAELDSQLFLAFGRVCRHVRNRFTSNNQLRSSRRLRKKPPREQLRLQQQAQESNPGASSSGLRHNSRARRGSRTRAAGNAAHHSGSGSPRTIRSPSMEPLWLQTSQLPPNAQVEEELLPHGLFGEEAEDLPLFSGPHFRLEGIARPQAALDFWCSWDASTQCCCVSASL